MIGQEVKIVVSGSPHPRPQPRDGVVPTNTPRVAGWRIKMAKAISDAAFEVGEAVIEKMHEGCLSLSVEFRMPIPANKKTWVGLAHHHDDSTQDLMAPVYAELHSAKLLPKDRGRIAELIVRKVWCKPADGGCTLILKPLPAAYVGVKHADMPRWLEEAVVGGGGGGR